MPVSTSTGRRSARSARSAVTTKAAKPTAKAAPKATTKPALTRPEAMIAVPLAFKVLKTAAARMSRLIKNWNTDSARLTDGEHEAARAAALDVAGDQWKSAEIELIKAIRSSSPNGKNTRIPHAFVDDDRRVYIAFPKGAYIEISHCCGIHTQSYVI
jgi:hypothetical protein